MSAQHFQKAQPGAAGSCTAPPMAHSLTRAPTRKPLQIAGLQRKAAGQQRTPQHQAHSSYCGLFTMPQQLDSKLSKLWPENHNHSGKSPLDQCRPSMCKHSCIVVSHVGSHTSGVDCCSEQQRPPRMQPSHNSGNVDGPRQLQHAGIKGARLKAPQSAAWLKSRAQA
jgi:hypothetical protein